MWETVWDFFLFLLAYECPIVQKAVFPPLNCFCNFVKNQWVMFVWVVFHGSLFCSNDLFVYPSDNTVLIAIAIYSWNKIDWFPPSSFLIKIVLASLVPLLSYINFRMILAICKKKLAKILIGIALNLYLS